MLMILGYERAMGTKLLPIQRIEVPNVKGPMKGGQLLRAFFSKKDEGIQNSQAIENLGHQRL